MTHHQTLLTGSLFLALLSSPRPAAAAPFSGTFINSEGDRVVLRQGGNRVSGVIHSGGQRGTVSGTVQGKSLRGRSVLGGGSITFTARVTAAGIRVTLQDGNVELYRRAGAAAPGEARRSPPARGAPVAPPTSNAEAAGPAPGRHGAVSRGRVHKQPYEGWSFRIPRGWKSARKGDTVLLGGMREAGLIMVQAKATTSVAVMQQGLGQVLARLGVFPATPRLRRVRLVSGPAVYAEARGRTRDGKAIRVRAVGVMCKRGTVAVIGLTTTDGNKFAVLRRRIDGIARSLKFFKPRVSPARRLLAGEWYSFSRAWSATGGGGSEATLSLCPDGRYFSSWDASYSGHAGKSGAWGQAAQSGGAGRWRAMGGRQKGTVVVTRGNGSTVQIRYSVQSNSVVYFDGRKYARSSWKRCR